MYLFVFVFLSCYFLKTLGKDPAKLDKPSDTKFTAHHHVTLQTNVVLHPHVTLRTNVVLVLFRGGLLTTTSLIAINVGDWGTLRDQGATTILTDIPCSTWYGEALLSRIQN